MTPLRAVLTSMAATIVVLGVLLAIHMNLDRVIGITGIFFTVVTFALTQLQLRDPGSHKVAFIAKSRSPFARNILRGLEQELRETTELRLTEYLPDHSVEDLLAWQLQLLRSLSSRDLSAVVIIPSADAIELWTELAVLTQRGAFVVVVDVKPSNRVFNELRARRPAFVGSDFDIGGQLVAQYLLERLTSVAKAHVVACLGPASSWPAVQRGAKLLYHLASAGYSSRLSYVTIESWNTSVARDAIVSGVQLLLRTHTGAHFFVFCANDRILCAVQEAITKMGSSAASRISLIGYDGATDEDGRYIVTLAPSACATVDAVPLDQGRACAAFVLNEYHDRLANSWSTFIRPTLKTLEGRTHAPAE